jgi:hypothetical protein
MEIINLDPNYIALNDAEMLLAHERNMALGYLASTDWYATRMAETGKAIPEEIIAERAKARDRISVLRA